MNRSDAETLWEVARVLARDAAKVSPAPALPPLLFFTDPVRTPRPWETAARLPAGAAVVFRHFGLADARETGLRLREVTAAGGVPLLGGLDAGLAGVFGAGGMALPENAPGPGERVSAAHPDWIVTGAAHAGSALNLPHLHARVLSPLFAAGGTSSATPPLGLTTFEALAASASCPLYALGGIDAKNAHSLIGSGACGIGGVSAIQAAFSA